MYSIFADETCIYNDVTPLNDRKLINPKITMEDCAAGSLEFTIPPGNIGYDIIKPMTTDIIVYSDSDEIWRGRVLNESIDFYKRKKLYCEGELAFLNDTIQPPHEYSASTGTDTAYITYGTTVRSFLEAIIKIHNENAPSNRQFAVGIVDVEDGDEQDDNDSILRYTNYESTLKCINEKLIDRLGGHLIVKHQNGVGIINYYKDDSDLIKGSEQQIMFGHNLLDYTQDFTMENLSTVVVPRGNRLEESPIEALDAYLTVENAQVEDPDNPGQTKAYGSIYVEASEEVMKAYGRIIAVVDWENVSDPTTLLSKARKYLEKEQFDKISLVIQSLDLHYLNKNIKRLDLLEKVQCISKPHGMNKTFMVTKVSISLDQPDSSTYTLGTDSKKTLTEATNKINEDALAAVEQIPSENSILDAAKRQAFAILAGNDGGYVRFIKDSNDSIKEIRISDGKTDETSLSMWIWNNSGLGCLVRPDYESEWDYMHIKEALTKDGQIVAERITAGTLTGQTIEGATINGGVINSPSPEGQTGSVHISGGTLIVDDGTSGYARFRKANDHDTYIAIGGGNIACARPGYYREFDGKWIFEAGAAFKGVSDNGHATLSQTIDCYVYGPQGAQRADLGFINGLLASVNYK